MERKPQYKKSLLEYFGVNSLLFNESSIGEVLGYLSQAIAGERFDRQSQDNRNTHHHQTMKAILLVLFLKSHEQYAYASRKCLLDVVSQNFGLFMRAILPVSSIIKSRMLDWFDLENWSILKVNPVTTWSRAATGRRTSACCWSTTACCWRRRGSWSATRATSPTTHTKPRISLRSDPCVVCMPASKLLTKHSSLGAEACFLPGRPF